MNTHGMYGKSTWMSWKSMKARCLNPKAHAYQNYGGRGITIYQPWIDEFGAFLSDMGSRPSLQHTLDRIDNSLGYFPGNCRWATWEQQGNNRRTNIVVEFKGQSRTIAQWSRLLKINKATLYRRIRRQHWSVEKALSARWYVGNQHISREIVACHQEMIAATARGGRKRANGEVGAEE